MIVKTNFRHNYSGDPIRFLNLDEFSDSNDDVVLTYGLGAMPTHYEKGTYYIDLELPILGPYNVLKYEKFCDKVITLCPYTSEWLNNITKSGKFCNSFFPLDPKYLADHKVKNFDVIYTGQLNSQEIYETVKKITKFKYCHVCYNGDFATHHNISYSEKLSLIGQSKISLIHNLWWPQNDSIQRIRSAPNYLNNKAYERLDEGIVPQLKSRLFEAAFNKSLMLVRKDPWNLVEDFFVENEDFVYYRPESVDETVGHILEEYDSYGFMIENAYNKAINNYTTKHFAKDILK